MRTITVLFVAVGSALPSTVRDAAPVEAPPRHPPIFTNCLDVAQAGPFRELIHHPLTTEGVAGLPITEAIADDPALAKVATYLVQCALPPEAALSISTADGPLELTGGVGLAPEWAQGPCDDACQEWVSACMLARTNVYGIPVAIYMSGPHPALGGLSAADAADFPTQEGAFYGNIFLEPQRQLSCRGAGNDPFYSTVRVCTKPGNLCGIAAAGSCGGAEPLCAWNEQGWFEDCRGRPGAEKVWSRVVTIHLRASSFATGRDAACDTAPAFEAPKLPGGGIGAPCWNDSDCEGDCAICDARNTLGLCTAGCKDATPEMEQEECGGDGTTCLSQTGDGGLCTAACVPGEGTCAPAQICTGFWVLREGPDAAGCYPFCSADSDCPPGTACQTRYGICGPAVDMAALPDGDPCVMAPTGNAAPEIPCRGACFRVTADPTQGICGSFLNTRVTPTCWDHPDHIKPIIPFGEDELGVCLYRKCSADPDCTSPLVCTGTVFSGKRCNWP